MVGDECPAVFESPLASAGTGLARWCARLGPAGWSVVSWDSYSAGFGRDLCEFGSGVVGDADASAETSGATSTDSPSESSWGAGNSVVWVDQAKPSHLRGTDWGWQLLVVGGAGRFGRSSLVHSPRERRGRGLLPVMRLGAPALDGAAGAQPAGVLRSRCPQSGELRHPPAPPLQTI